MYDSVINWADFEKIEMRIGTIIDVADFPKARNPAYQITIDFGEYGYRKSSAQITRRYTKAALIGKQIVAVVNFPPKQIGNFMSECLILGAIGKNGDVILLQPENETQNGLRIG